MFSTIYTMEITGNTISIWYKRGGGNEKRWRATGKDKKRWYNATSPPGSSLSLSLSVSLFLPFARSLWVKRNNCALLSPVQWRLEGEATTVPLCTTL